MHRFRDAFLSVLVVEAGHVALTAPWTPARILACPEDGSP